MSFYPSTNKNVVLGEIALNKHTVSFSFCSVNVGIMSYEDWSLMSLLVDNALPERIAPECSRTRALTKRGR